MKILVIGSGAREHALIWKMKQSPEAHELFCAPGNAGTSFIAHNIDIAADDIQKLKEFAKTQKIDLTVVGPELPLSLGIVDLFEKEGLSIIGVRKKEAQLEASKVFSKKLLLKYKIPTAPARFFDSYSEAEQYIQNISYPVVIKADGLAQGKGVKICFALSEALDALNEMMVQKKFGKASEIIVIEEFLQGEEVSLIGFMDGTHFIICQTAQDYKRVLDGDQGPNTGGMGAYSPVPWFDTTCENKVQDQIITPLLKAFECEGLHYKGILYIGLLFHKGNPYVLEFNVRFGDPETQVLMLRLKTDLVSIFKAMLDGKLKNISMEWDKRPGVGVVLASQGYPGEYKTGFEISGVETIRFDNDVALFHAATVLKDKKILTSGGRVMTVVALGNTYRDAQEHVYQALSKIHWDNCYYRKDIGRKLWQK